MVGTSSRLYMRLHEVSVWRVGGLRVLWSYDHNCIFHQPCIVLTCKMDVYFMILLQHSLAATRIPPGLIQTASAKTYNGCCFGCAPETEWQHQRYEVTSLAPGMTQRRILSGRWRVKQLWPSQPTANARVAWRFPQQRVCSLYHRLSRLAMRKERFGPFADVT